MRGYLDNRTEENYPVKMHVAKKLNIGYSDDVSLFLNGKILYRGRSAQRFRDPGFLGIVNPENDSRYTCRSKRAETN